MVTNLGQMAMLVTTNHQPMAMLVTTHFTKLVLTHLAE